MSPSYAFQPILHEKLENNPDKSLSDALRLDKVSIDHKIELGGTLNENPTLQFRVKSKEPHYWRGMAYDSYTGDGFEITDNQKTAYFPDTPFESKNSNGKLLTQQFIIFSPQPPILFAAYEPYILQDYGSVIEMDSYQALYIPSGLKKGETYSITSRIAQFNPDDLRNSSTDYPFEIKEKYLKLPEIPKRVRDLAYEVTSNSNNPFDKANSINSYLKSSGNYFYNLKVKSPPAGRNAVDYFLFDSKEGYCTYFASAMVVMARSAGIPARFVTGYATGIWNPITETFDVSGDDAHAWVEVYFEGYGWVEFDPTTGLCSPGSNCLSRPRLDLPLYSNDSQNLAQSHAQKMPTVTSINSHPEVAYRGNQFKIEGYVSTLNGSGAEDMEIKIFANESKSIAGSLIGTARTDSKGVFNADITIPREFDTGTYDIIAVSIENQKYSGSDSDPRIIIKSKTVLTLDLKYEENILKLEGSLTDDAGEPVGDLPVEIFINDTLVNTAITDGDGKYSIEHNIAHGEYDVKAAFSETIRYGESSIIRHFNTDKKYVNLSVSVKPESLDRNNTLEIFTRIESQNKPLFNATVILNDSLDKIGEFASNEKGTISTTYKIPLNATLGRHEIIAEFNGDANYNKAQALTGVFIYSNTFLSIFSDKQKVDTDGSLNISGILSSDDFHPLGNKQIEVLAGDTIINTAVTNDSGIYYIPVKASQLGTGKNVIQAKFNSDSQLYKSTSSGKIDIEVSGITQYLFIVILMSILLTGIIYYYKSRKRTEKQQKNNVVILQQERPNILLNPKECVIAFYDRAVEKLEKIGIKKNPEFTHWEFFQKVAGIKSSISSNLKKLTQLYEEAYYSNHTIEAKNSDQAKELYKYIYEDVEKK